MYEVMDQFLGVDTWRSMHPLDLKRFNSALAEIVEDEQFSPEAMGEYMRNKTGIARSNKSDEIDTFVNRAWAIRDFIRRND